MKQRSIAYLRFIISCCIVFTSFQSAIAQQSTIVSHFYDSVKRIYPDSLTKLPVASISINGNKKTKTYLILREVQFKTGDSLSVENMSIVLEQARRQVYNLNLFSEVSITPSLVASDKIAVVITVREKWYLYPTPQFQLVDRNFNDWLKTYNADFSRVVFGVKFAHYNFTGRGDQLRIFLLNGYSRNISFSYSAPASDSKLSEGFRVSAGYTQNREIAYKTDPRTNQLLQFKQDHFVRNAMFASVSYQARKGFFKRSYITLSYTYLNLDDSVITSKYNPEYFGTNRSSIGFPDLSYTFQYTNVDHINYPLTGTVAGVTVVKRGFGLAGSVNMVSVDAAYIRYLSHFHNRLYSTIQLYGKLKAPFKLAYINQRSLGYGEVYLRGQEYYVIDGSMAAVAKYTVKKKLLSFKIPFPFHIRQLPNIPFTFFAKAYGDLGYAYSEREFESRLNNRLLYTGGFGIDILTVYGININLEYSFNQLGENGLFLHGKGGF